MILDTIFVARAYSVTGGELNILGVGLTRLSPAVLPWHEPTLTVLARFFVEESDPQRAETEVAVRIEDPENQPLQGVVRWALTAEDAGEQLAHLAPGELATMNFVANISNATFEVPGLHHVVVTVEGEEIDRYPLYVFPPEPATGDLT